MPIGSFLLKAALCAVAGVPVAALGQNHRGEDQWDVDQYEVPPVTTPKPPLKPILFECPNLLTITGESVERISLAVAPCPEKPRPVSFTVCRKTDTAVWIELIAGPPRGDPRTGFDPHTRDFHLHFVWRESPADTAVFRVWRDEKDCWRIESIRSVPFIRLAPNQAPALPTMPSNPGIPKRKPAGQ